jgi:hypothetical protein
MIGGEYREVWGRGKCSSLKEVWRGVISWYLFALYQYLSMDCCSSVVPSALEVHKTLLGKEMHN